MLSGLRIEKIDIDKLSSRRFWSFSIPHCRSTAIIIDDSFYHSLKTRKEPFGEDARRIDRGVFYSEILYSLRRRSVESP